MSMPAGKSFNHGYGSRAIEGMGYREIAERMTVAGDKMNHSTARNVVLRALEKIAQPLVNIVSQDAGQDAAEVARDPRFQASMIAMLQDIYD
jgi:hypothetical protein|tara:strand:+ start:1660 stop:1935 length:276 start_codon:yes stop_codon:yes gene_type:complete